MTEIVRHATLEGCMAAYLGCAPESLSALNRWEWWDGDVLRVWPLSRVMRSRRKVGTWGWCESKNRIHVWVADHAEPSKIARLIGHELGHMQRPFKKAADKEEIKAESFADVAQMTFEITEKFLKERG